MRTASLAVILLVVSVSGHAATPDWNKQLAGTMPLLGHRNWILVVDSAYPLQTSPGVETIETNASQLEVVGTVLSEIERSIQALNKMAERLWGDGREAEAKALLDALDALNRALDRIRIGESRRVVTLH